jgi:pyruvate dehydrogenase E2 component (dihydrolipoamide acetyltransferase)
MISRIIRRLSSYPSHLVIKMPALSPTMESGNIGEFKKRIGDSVEPGDVLVEIETDKATMDFELQEEGFVARLLANTGDKDVKVNSPLAILVHDASHVDKFKDWSHDAENTAATSASENTAATSASENTAATSASENTANTASLIGNIANRVFASPAAKALALKSNIALSNINGSGPNSRILLSDVKNHQPTPVALPKSSPPVAPVAPVSPAFKDIPVSNIRKVIAKRLLESKQQIPHYYLTSEISVDKLLK